MATLELEMALEIADTEGRAWTEAVRYAAEAAGGELVFVLPDPAEDGSDRSECAIVRLREDDETKLVSIRETDDGFEFRDEAAIDPSLRDFARSSIEVLERLRSDLDFVALPEADERAAA
ncbi:hypothetical protein [Propylenella binzhouense]|uniref:Uncharacterized protein n=1 Tax=Propylenella binzhouense TaxID=2555902 RepID=A0A964T5N2_9HYPH|nr:hypothetical protein [Propylenella binzhouense]MYZ47907.1 hypothetical protein [Propylenella binzhouense]